MKRANHLPAALALAAAALLGAGQASASTAAGTMGVSMTINGACVFSSSAPVAFAAQGVLTSAVTANGSITVQCTNTLPYTVALGTGAGATTSARKMTSGANTVNYALYRDAGLQNNWGNVQNVDTASGIGNGAVQTLTVYGQVPAQTTPAAAAYADTVNVTITY